MEQPRSETPEKGPGIRLNTKTAEGAKVNGARGSTAKAVTSFFARINLFAGNKKNGAAQPSTSGESLTLRRDAEAPVGSTPENQPELSISALKSMFIDRVKAIAKQCGFKLKSAMIASAESVSMVGADGKPVTVDKLTPMAEQFLAECGFVKPFLSNEPMSPLAQGWFMGKDRKYPPLWRHDLQPHDEKWFPHPRREADGWVS